MSPLARTIVALAATALLALGTATAVGIYVNHQLNQITIGGHQ